jgi:predicted glycogen debranching enzyme
MMDIKFFDGPLFENFYNEWILTNGRGGFALGFGNLINERKYDGLLIASDDNLVRNHLVSSIEEKVFIHNSSFYLDSNNYLNIIYPYGYRHLVKSYMRPFPFFLYSSYPFNSDILIAKYLMMHPDKNINIVFYTNYSSEKMNIELKPKFSCRFYHNINKPGTFDNISYILDSEKSMKEYEIYFQRNDNNIGVYTYIYDESEIPNFKIFFQKNIYRNIYYSREAERGYDSFEDLINPFTINKTLEKGETFALIFSDSKITVEIENYDKNKITTKEDELIHEIKNILRQ